LTKNLKNVIYALQNLSRANIKRGRAVKMGILKKVISKMKKSIKSQPKKKVSKPAKKAPAGKLKAKKAPAKKPPAKKAPARKAPVVKAKVTAKKAPAAQKAPAPAAQRGGGRKPSNPKELLMAMRSQIMAGISRNVKTEGDNPDKETGDMYDQATSERDRELNLLLTTRDQEKLKEIESALQKIKEGTYGDCEECGEKIPQGRLMVMPFARVCVNCRSKIEKEESTKKTTEEDQAFQTLSYNETEEEEA